MRYATVMYCIHMMYSCKAALCAKSSAGLQERQMFQCCTDREEQARTACKKGTWGRARMPGAAITGAVPEKPMTHVRCPQQRPAGEAVQYGTGPWDTLWRPFHTLMLGHGLPAPSVLPRSNPLLWGAGLCLLCVRHSPGEACSTITKFHPQLCSHGPTDHPHNTAERGKCLRAHSVPQLYTGPGVTPGCHATEAMKGLAVVYQMLMCPEAEAW